MNIDVKYVKQTNNHIHSPKEGFSLNYESTLCWNIPGEFI